jgi:hypothetical protein
MESLANREPGTMPNAPAAMVPLTVVLMNFLRELLVCMVFYLW